MAFALGPALSSASSGSFDIMHALVSGDCAKTGLHFDFSTWMVDVRDVAEAHVAAPYIPYASGRFINTNETKSLSELGDCLRKADVVPVDKLPPTKNFEGGDVWRADNSKS